MHINMPPKKTPAKKAFPKKKKEIIWSDDEVELLLNVANESKVAKAAESVDASSNIHAFHACDWVSAFT